MSWCDIGLSAVKTKAQNKAHSIKCRFNNNYPFFVNGIIIKMTIISIATRPYPPPPPYTYIDPPPTLRGKLS